MLPVILIGHSLGGDASIVMSNWLAQNGVPVRFVVIFDAVAQTHPIIGGVQEVLNFYKPKGYGQEVKAAPSFNGVISNVDLTDRKDIDHLNIDEDPVLQAEVTAESSKYLTENGKPAKKKSTPTAKAAPPTATKPPRRDNRCHRSAPPQPARPQRQAQPPARGPLATAARRTRPRTGEGDATGAGCDAGRGALARTGRSRLRTAGTADGGRGRPFAGRQPDVLNSLGRGLRPRLAVSRIFHRCRPARIPASPSLPSTAAASAGLSRSRFSNGSRRSSPRRRARPSGSPTAST